jgi:thiosulfate reductase cytochrome b subunit
MPVLIVTGLLLLFPELAPSKVLGAGGIWPMAVVHSIAGFLASLFMIGHIYLATTGEKVLTDFKEMITGWHESHETVIKPAKSPDDKILR